MTNQNVRRAPGPARPIFHGFGRPNRIFHGREQITADVLRRLDADHLAVLSGPAGIGKSQIARRIAFLERDRYGLAMRFESGSEAELVRGMGRAAVMYGLADEMIDDPERLTALLSGLAAEHPRALVVFDGIGDVLPDFVTGRHAFPGADIVITTRGTAGADPSAVIPVGPFAPGEAHTFLAMHSSTRRRADDDAETIPALCGLLGNFPLALEYARAYVNGARCSYGEYIRIWNENKEGILRRMWSEHEGIR